MDQEIIDNLKINFVGSQGTGKSTLLEAMKKDEEFKGLKFQTEIVRDLVKEKNLSINESGNANSQKIFFDAYKEVLEKTGYVSDRCLIDVYAYTNWLYDHKSTNKEQELKSLYEEILRQRTSIRNRDFGLVIYFPIEFDIVADGVRSVNKEFQKEIDGIIIDTLTKFDISYFTITGSVEQRLKQLKEIIFSYVKVLQHNEKRQTFRHKKRTTNY